MRERGVNVFSSLETKKKTEEERRDIFFFTFLLSVRDTKRACKRTYACKRDKYNYDDSAEKAPASTEGYVKIVNSDDISLSNIFFAEVESDRYKILAQCEFRDERVDEVIVS